MNPALINFFSIPDFGDINDAVLIVDGIDDPIISLAKAITLTAGRELFRASAAGILGKLPDSQEYSLEILLGYFIKLFEHGLGHDQFISAHLF